MLNAMGEWVETRLLGVSFCLSTENHARRLCVAIRAGGNLIHDGPEHGELQRLAYELYEQQFQ